MTSKAYLSISLLNDTKTVSKEDRQALRKLQKNGVDIVIASGRFESAHRKLTRALDLGLEDSIHIAEGGGVIYEGDHKEIMGFLDPEDYQTILNRLREHNIQAYVSDGEKVYYDSSGPLDKLYKPDLDTEQKIFEKVEDLSQIEKALKFIIFCDSAETLNELQEIKVPGTKAFLGTKIIAEITSEKLDKWYALERIIQEKDLKPQEVAAIGDSGNDLLMIEKAGLGLAVANAFADVLETADQVSVKDHNHNAVAELIETYILNFEEENA